jgi:hypothetical protein
MRLGLFFAGGVALQTALAELWYRWKARTR